MKVQQLGIIYSSIERVFDGDSRPLDLAGVLPIKLDDLRYLLLSNRCIDINGNLEIGCTFNRFLFTITMYYALRPKLGFTRARFGVPG